MTRWISQFSHFFCAQPQALHFHGSRVFGTLQQSSTPVAVVACLIPSKTSRLLHASLPFTSLAKSHRCNVRGHTTSAQNRVREQQTFLAYASLLRFLSPTLLRKMTYPTFYVTCYCSLQRFFFFQGLAPAYCPLRHGALFVLSLFF